MPAGGGVPPGVGEVVSISFIDTFISMLCCHNHKASDKFLPRSQDCLVFH
jgi:hypothetical protein